MLNYTGRHLNTNYLKSGFCSIDSRLVFHTDFKYIIIFFRSNHIFFLINFEICENHKYRKNKEN